MRAAPLRVAILLVMVLLVPSTGCRSTPDEMPGSTNLRIANVSFEGVSVVDVRDLEESLVTRENRFNPFESTRRLNRFSLATDIQRIEAFYHRRGYFEARVVDYQVEEDEERERAHIRFEIDEGRPTIISNVSYEVSRIRQIDADELLGGLQLTRGRVFSEIEAERARNEMRRRLMEYSYAYASVDLRVYVNRETRRAELFFFIDQGPASLFGEVEVVGNNKVPDDVITERIRVREGSQYRHSLLRVAQLQLYDMNTFSFVSVESAATRDEQRNPLSWNGSRPEGTWHARTPGFREEVERAHADASARGYELVREVADPPPRPRTPVAQSGLDLFGEVDTIDPNVPIRITVSELPAANYRAGGGFGLESGRTEAYTRASAVWRNLFAPLNRVELESRAGYAWLPNIVNPHTGGLVFSVQGRYSRPGAVFRFFDFSTRLRYDEDIEIGYRYASPQARIALARRLSQVTTLSFGYNVDILFIRNDELAGTQVSDELLPSEVFLAYLDASIQIDHRDDILQPRSGWFAEFAVQLGDPYVLGNYSYLRILPEVRHYWRLARRLTLATRLRVGTILRLGGDPVPRTQRFFEGGGNSIRGFSRREVSPYAFVARDGSEATDPSCLLAPDSEDRCRRVPIGGFSTWVANIEPRYEIGRDWLWGVAFLDAGSVADESVTWRFRPNDDGMHLGAGAGLRIGTPVGPLRFDFGWRLTDAIEYTNSSRFGFYISLGEAF